MNAYCCEDRIVEVWVSTCTHCPPTVSQLCETPDRCHGDYNNCDYALAGCGYDESSGMYVCEYTYLTDSCIET